MDKRGLSHIEVLLSFLIFMGFVIFSLYFFSPARTSTLVNSSLSYTLREIKENVTVEIESFSVSLELSAYEEDVFVKIDFSEVDGNKNSRIEDVNGIFVESEKEESSGYVRFRIGDVYNSDTGKGFAVFRFSEEYSEGSVTGAILVVEEEEYEIISSEKIEFLSEKKLRDLGDLYLENDQGYNGLISAFNLPERANFEFVIEFEDSGRNIVAERPRPPGVEVFSDLERVEILNINGEIEFADLIVRVW
jgi:hypothetical protein